MAFKAEIKAFPVLHFLIAAFCSDELSKFQSQNFREMKHTPLHLTQTPLNLFKYFLSFLNNNNKTVHLKDLSI